MTINHIHIGTKDIKKSTEFYEKIFNFNRKLQHGAGIFIYNEAGFMIAMDQLEEIPTFPTWFHLGFCLSSEAEVQKIYQKVKQENVKIARDMANEKDQFASFFIFDPNRYKIEVSWHAD
jgi:catechol 2,3-dioxygenase-like lactoylglutathione lyase family enzyme